MYVNQVPHDFTEVRTMASCYRALKDTPLPILIQVYKHFLATCTWSALVDLHASICVHNTERLVRLGSQVFCLHY